MRARGGIRRARQRTLPKLPETGAAPLGHGKVVLLFHCVTLPTWAPTPRKQLDNASHDGGSAAKSHAQRPTKLSPSLSLSVCWAPCTWKRSFLPVCMVVNPGASGLLFLK
jgi:hypothetical protein